MTGAGRVVAAWHHRNKVLLLQQQQRTKKAGAAAPSSSATAAARNSTTALCLTIPRCRLVYQHSKNRNSNSNNTTSAASLLDAKLTNTFGYVPNVTDDGTVLVSERTSYSEMLQYKVIVILEGNDISSGLKWALYSNSVVLMPKPTFTSWAMEERLVPYVHYVPLRTRNRPKPAAAAATAPGGTTDGEGEEEDDSSSQEYSEEEREEVERKIRWILDHEAAAQRISQQATLWMHDLLFAPDAEADDIAIYREIVRRYRAHFGCP
jgi:Glycosyl transferase family 90